MDTLDKSDKCRVGFADDCYDDIPNVEKECKPVDNGENKTAVEAKKLLNLNRLREDVIDCRFMFDSLHAEYARLIKNIVGKNDSTDKSDDDSLEKEREACYHKELGRAESGQKQICALLLAIQQVQMSTVGYINQQWKVNQIKRENDWMNEELLRCRVMASKMSDEIVDVTARCDSIEASITSNEHSSDAVVSSSRQEEDLFEIFVDDEDNAFIIPTHLAHVNQLIGDYVSQCKFAIAYSLCEKSLNDALKATTVVLDDVAILLVMAFFVRKTEEKFDEAQNLITKALRIVEKREESTSYALIPFINNLAECNCRLNDYVAAKKLYSRALKILKLDLPEDHVHIGKQYANIAVCYHHMCKFDKASDFMSRSISVYESQYGETHADTLKAKCNFSSSLIAQGNYQHAEILVEEVLLILHKYLLKSDNVEDEYCTLYSIAKTHQQLARGDAYVPPFDRYEIFHKRLRLKGTVFRTALNNIITIYNNTERPVAATVITKWIDYCENKRRAESTLLQFLASKEPTNSEDCETINTGNGHFFCADWQSAKTTTSIHVTAEPAPFDQKFNIISPPRYPRRKSLLSRMKSRFRVRRKSSSRKSHD